MKLPRWVVICLLSTSVASSLLGAVWWWVVWPERTARHFRALLVEGRFDEANGMMAGAKWELWPDSQLAVLKSNTDEVLLGVPPEVLKSVFGHPSAKLDASDFLRGRRRFRGTVGASGGIDGVAHVILEFTVERGRVASEVLTAPGGR